MAVEMRIGPHVVILDPKAWAGEHGRKKSAPQPYRCLHHWQFNHGSPCCMHSSKDAFVSAGDMMHMSDDAVPAVLIACVRCAC